MNKEEIKDKKKEQKISADFAWRIYNFVSIWQSGFYGTIPLQEALDKDFVLNKKIHNIK